jgi:hypothetical protein
MFNKHEESRAVREPAAPLARRAESDVPAGTRRYRIAFGEDTITLIRLNAIVLVKNITVNSWYDEQLRHKVGNDASLANMLTSGHDIAFAQDSDGIAGNLGVYASHADADAGSPA